MDSELPREISLLEGRVNVNPFELLGRSRATDRDVVVLSGTLLEGFGNLYSDLDLYVIGEHLPMNGVELPAPLVLREDGCIRRVNDKLLESNSILLDVQYYTFQELDTLARSLRTLYAESRQTTQIYRKTLHHEDEDLIHKLLTGTLLQDGSNPFAACEIFEPGMFCFLKYRNETGGYAEFRDLVGSWTAGDLDTCLYNIRSYLVSQVTGMMFLAGSTNPRPKWFVRRLASLDARYSDLREGVMAWLQGERRTQRQKNAAVEEACELIDMAFRHARTLLDTNPRFFSAEEALTMTEREFAERGGSDNDTLAEWQLRRHMFSATQAPLITQIRGPSSKAYATNGSHVALP